jgi:L-asparaginase/Glu-tRNA(Gln) amidotransferase subunit D
MFEMSQSQDSVEEHISEIQDAVRSVVGQIFADLPTQESTLTAKKILIIDAGGTISCTHCEVLQDSSENNVVESNSEHSREQSEKKRKVTKLMPQK